MAKFERTEEYQAKLFEQALFDEKQILTDARITIQPEHGWTGKLKAYCHDSDTFLQFPRALREEGKEYTADVIEVIRDDGVRKYYRAMKGSIRRSGSDEVVA